jgi:uracil-DNA glycosylase
MENESLTEYYELLSLAQDYLAWGYRRNHRTPEFRVPAQDGGAAPTAGGLDSSAASAVPEGRSADRAAQAPSGSWSDGPGPRGIAGQAGHALSSASGEALAAASARTNKLPGTEAPDDGDIAPGMRLPPISGQREASAVIESEFDSLSGAVSECRLCRLCEGRTNAVFGMGVFDPLVMVIGEGPGADEDRQGLPFVGRAGIYLDKMLQAVDLDRGRNCYIGNVVKCRPPNNRDPQPDEISACRPYLERQIELLHPRVILAVGRISSKSLLGVEESMGKLHGREFAYRGIPLVPTYHPAAVLRDQGLRRPVWEDLKVVRGLVDE